MSLHKITTEVLGDESYYGQPWTMFASGAVSGLIQTPQKIFAYTGMLGLFSLSLFPGQTVPSKALKSRYIGSPSGIEMIHSPWRNEDLKVVSVEEAVPISRQIAEIRYQFALNVKQLADVLHVERPTIYAWMKGETGVRNANRDKLDRLFKLTRECAQIMTGPLSVSMLNTKYGAISLLQALSVDPPDREGIDRILAQIEKSRAGKGERELFLTAADILKSHNLPEPSEEIQRVNFELGTDGA